MVGLEITHKHPMSLLNRNRISMRFGFAVKNACRNTDERVYRDRDCEGNDGERGGCNIR